MAYAYNEDAARNHGTGTENVIANPIFSANCNKKDLKNIMNLVRHVISALVMIGSPKTQSLYAQVEKERVKFLPAEPENTHPWHVAVENRSTSVRMES